MEDSIFLGIIIGLVIGLVFGMFIGMGCSNSSKIQDKLRKTESNLNEVTTERDTYKNLILEKSLGD